MILCFLKRFEPPRNLAMLAGPVETLEGVFRGVASEEGEPKKHEPVKKNTLLKSKEGEVVGMFVSFLLLNDFLIN